MRSLAVSVSLAVVAAAMVAGREVARREPFEPIRLPGALVIAREPTLAEVLDLVLGAPDEADRTASGVNYDPQSDPEVQRVANVLARHTNDRARADRIAQALVGEGRRSNLGSMLLVGVVLTENPSLEPGATSRVGARGLMQVMPFHAGEWGCASRDLFDIESNICHGVRILAAELRDAGDLSRALLRYNGCVRGTNTPDCRQYARWVYHRAHVSAERAPSIAGVTPFALLDRSSPRGRRAIPR
jgi:soluble lytic murein transglycosylase-like protein